MKNNIIILIGTATLLLTSCQKDAWYGYHYQLSKSHFPQHDWVKVPYTGKSIVSKAQARNIQALDANTLEMVNTDPKIAYRIDTSWVEVEKCLGCKDQ